MFLPTPLADAQLFGEDALFETARIFTIPVWEAVETFTVSIQLEYLSIAIMK
jgi:hypothetical protein